MITKIIEHKKAEFVTIRLFSFCLCGWFTAYSGVDRLRVC